MRIVRQYRLGVAVLCEKPILQAKSSLYYIAEVKNYHTPLTGGLLTGDSSVATSASQLAMLAVLVRSISCIGGCISHKDLRIKRSVVALLHSIGLVRRPVFSLQPRHPAHGCMLSPHSHLQERSQTVKVQIGKRAGQAMCDSENRR